METSQRHVVLRSRFTSSLGFEPDRFQSEAFDLLEDGRHVIVAAPTGAGKTLVAAYAVELAREAGRRLFYTTPIKALSNQKYHELVERHGHANVGLLTGDNALNPDAPVVVMTTEVLRNMLYAGNQLTSLATVVLDEVHYLQDAYRGPVWEEVIIHLPRSVQLLCLSATVSNASELAEWIETVRGPTSLVVETRRPVDLENLYLVAERGGSQLHLAKTVRGNKANPNGFRYDAQVRRSPGNGRGNRQQRGPRRKWRTPGWVETCELLGERDLLPAIHFIFSRQGCNDAARAVVNAGLVLTTATERDEIRAIVAERTKGISRHDLDLLDFTRFSQGLAAGVAAHHAGMVPPFKEAVEACFERGLVKVVFATETLALGINMPARTVVIEKLTKFTGETHELLTPAQYTQLTGRAGRRGIDTQGKAVVLWSPWVRFEQVADLALSRRFVLNSSFRPTYNMAANLVRRYDPERARQLLNLSFAQFRVDADVVRSEQHVEKLEARHDQIRRRIEREHGPVGELKAALATGSAVNTDPDLAEIAFALSQLTPGEVVELESPEIPAVAAVLAVSSRKGGKVRVKVVDRTGDVHEFGAGALDAPPVVAGQITLPEPYLPNSVTFAHEASELLSRTRLGSSKHRRRLGPTGTVRTAADVPAAARKALRRLGRIEDDLDQVRASAGQRARSLAAQFDRVIELLADWGHLEWVGDGPGAGSGFGPGISVGHGGSDNGDRPWRLTPSGQRLARLYHECDLLVVEALEDGLFDQLNPAELAALASSFAYEERRGPTAAGRPEPARPSSKLRQRYSRLADLHRRLAAAESTAQLSITRRPDAGFMAIAHHWAAGVDLSDVLAGEELTAGDFVRTAKQMVDLLRQLGTLAPDPATASAARSAAEAVNRGLVAASSVVGIVDDPADDDAELGGGP